uniref:Dynein light chain n=1 Tax=Otus sunia TaxID=257818 RepID=A0A8C8E9I4_9STRI
MSDRKAVIKGTDMSEEMQQKYNVERQMTALTKREFEQKRSPNRHCIVGRKSGSSVSHEIWYFTFFLMHGVNILFKAG